MGLNCSHGAFDGAYGAFHSFRKLVCEAAGGTFGDHQFELPDDVFLENEGLVHFLSHSDCDGKIKKKMCVKVANDLEKLLPKIAELDDGGYGHIRGAGGFLQVTHNFINGCHLAASNGESLKFR